MNTLRKTIDAAVILSIITGGLYVVGWAYWWTYFNYFGISSNQIDLSLQEVIVTTWWILLPLIIFFLLMEYLTDVENMDESKWYVSFIIKLMNKFMKKFRTVVYSSLLILAGATIVLFCGTENTPLIFSLLTIIISMVMISIYFVGEVLNKDYNSKNILILLVMASFYNIYSGFVKADRISNGIDGNKISFVHKNNESSFEKYIFISYMNGVYYVHKPQSSRFNFHTLMIHEDGIEIAKLSD